MSKYQIKIGNCDYSYERMTCITLEEAKKYADSILEDIKRDEAADKDWRVSEEKQRWVDVYLDDEIIYEASK
jgi:hypothetical protein